MRDLHCLSCGAPLAYRGRGRPPVLCSGCRKDEIAAKQRAYREANKDEIAAKKRAKTTQQHIADGKLCAECREQLRAPTTDGLCGFCRQGIPTVEQKLAARAAAA